jgi:hypothetical protein
MQNRKINYHKKTDENGYVYTQTINITKNEFDKINQHIISLSNNDEFLDSLACEKRSYVVPLILINDIIAFSSHTVRNIVANFLNITIKDRNTCFIVK